MVRAIPFSLGWLHGLEAIPFSLGWLHGLEAIPFSLGWLHGLELFHFPWGAGMENFADTFLYMYMPRSSYYETRMAAFGVTTKFEGFKEPAWRC